MIGRQYPTIIGDTIFPFTVSLNSFLAGIVFLVATVCFTNTFIMAIKISSAISGGLIGACVLTLLHEGVRKIDKDTPTIDSLGVNALTKVLKGFRESTLTKEQELFELTHTGEILSNALYFSIAGFGSKKNVMMRSALLGLTAGLGALVLPRYLGIEEETRSNKSKILTITRYLLGSLLAATTIKTMEKNQKKSKAINGLLSKATNGLLKEHHN